MCVQLDAAELDSREAKSLKSEVFLRVAGALFSFGGRLAILAGNTMSFFGIQIFPYRAVSFFFRGDSANFSRPCPLVEERSFSM